MGAPYAFSLVRVVYDQDAAVGSLLEFARLESLGDPVMHDPGIGQQPLHIRHLRLHLVKLGELRCDLRLLQLGLLLLLGDLRLRPSPLGSWLHQVAAGALQNYRERKD